VGTVAATFLRAARSAADIATDSWNSVILLLNVGKSPQVAQAGRTACMGSGEAVVYDLCEPSGACSCIRAGGRAAGCSDDSKLHP
jgi:hypothetical protein